MRWSTDDFFGQLVRQAPDLAELLVRQLLAYRGGELALSTVWPETQLPAGLITHLVSSDPEAHARSALSHPNVSADLVMEYLYSPNEDLQVAAVASSVISYEVLESLKDLSHLRVAIAGRADVDEAFLSSALSDSPGDVDAFWAVATSPGLTAKVARYVLDASRDFDAQVSSSILQELYRNPLCPDEIRAAIVLITGPQQERIDQLVTPNLITWTYLMLPDASREVIDALVSVGHPAGMLYEFVDTFDFPKDDGTSLPLLMEYEIAQRALWPTLLMRADADLSYIPSELNAEALILHVGDMEGISPRYGVQHNFAVGWSDLGFAMLPRPWIESALLPRGFSFSSEYIEEELQHCDFEVDDLARFACAYTFAAPGGFLTHTADAALALTELGINVILDLPEIWDAMYAARIKWEFVSPFSLLALDRDRRRTFIDYCIAAARSDDPNVREAGLKVLGFLAVIPPAICGDLTKSDMQALRGFRDAELDAALTVAESEPTALDAGALLNAAHQLEESGHDLKAVQLLQAAAALGHVLGVAKLSWRALQRDECDMFTDELEDCMPLVDAQWGEKSPVAVHNARSNLALCRLSLGGPPLAALAVWSASSASRHPESLLYQAVLAYREGDIVKARECLEGVDTETLSGLEDEFASETKVAQGWFLTWCRDCLRALELVS